MRIRVASETSSGRTRCTAPPPNRARPPSSSAAPERSWPSSRRGSATTRAAAAAPSAAAARGRLPPPPRFAVWSSASPPPFLSTRRLACPLRLLLFGLLPRVGLASLAALALEMNFFSFSSSVALYSPIESIVHAAVTLVPGGCHELRNDPDAMVQMLTLNLWAAQLVAFKVTGIVDALRKGTSGLRRSKKALHEVIATAARLAKGAPMRPTSSRARPRSSRRPRPCSRSYASTRARSPGPQRAAASPATCHSAARRRTGGTALEAAHLRALVEEDLPAKLGLAVVDAHGRRAPRAPSTPAAAAASRSSL